MQKWEYFALTMTWPKGFVNAIYIDNQEHQPPAKNQKPSEILNYFGSQGWELVCMNGSQYIFKRPV